MKALLAWVLNEPARLYAVVGLGMAVGLAAAFGRERHEGRRPNANWLINRLLVMPFMAVASIAIVSVLGLKAEAAMFAASMLSLLGYDALRVMEIRALKKLAGEEAAASLGEEIERVGGEEAIVSLPKGDSAPVIELVGARETPRRKELRRAYTPPKDRPGDLHGLIDDLDKVD